ncbi:MAG: hypothetical protein V3W44_01295 [Dehalococcoidales bacterium]
MTKGIVAFAGNVTLEKVIWDNVWGQYIFLKLAQQKNEIKIANPFKKFTKMRKGRVGTRFGAVFSLSNGDIFYNDEVMLKNWSDGSAGWGLHLWVSPDKDGFHPFMDQSSTEKPEFGLAMVELDDDNSAIDQDKRDRVEAAPKTRRTRTLSNYAAQLCRQVTFWEYLKSQKGVYIYQNNRPESDSAEWMRKYLGIDSRAELDSDRHVADQFHADIRRPYAKWNSLRTS